jgi:TATA-binding protein-associated factor Taf7
MNINGICKISNRFDNNQNIIKNEFQIETKSFNGGSITFGRLTYSSSKKVSVENKGSKETKFENYYISKPFACFDSEIADILKQSLGQAIEIQGILKIEQYVDNNGKKHTIEKIIITNAQVKTKEDNKHYQSKANGYQPESKVVKPVVNNTNFNDDSVPF